MDCTKPWAPILDNLSADIEDEDPCFMLSVSMRYNYSTKKANDKLDIGETCPRQMGWELTNQMAEYKKCKYRISESREIEMVKIENILVPQCDRFSL